MVTALTFALATRRRRKKRLQSGGTFAFSDEHDGAAVDIQHQRDVPVSAPNANLVNPQIGHMLQRRLGDVFLQVAF